MEATGSMAGDLDRAGCNFLHDDVAREHRADLVLQLQRFNKPGSDCMPRGSYRA